MHLKYESQLREPLVYGTKTYHNVTEDIVRPIEAKPSKLWYIGFYIAVALLLFGIYAIYRDVTYGIGQWNLNKTIGWGWDITNFVWWVGIGHAGTLISAILLLFRQGWRTGVNRAAEAMTIFAVMCAGQFPIWHMGRVWMAFFVLPYANTRGPLWVNFNSPLLWDVFAISTYFTVSLLFWYSGLLPDFGTVRDRAKTKLRKHLYGIASSITASNAIPSGSIIMWSGSIGSIPSGYVLCDGTNGTPNLKDSFVVGSGNSYAVGANGGFTSSVTSNVGTNLPLYYSLAFIQKT
jgi:molybdopterin-containing oxidoreductase family membrane subunit